MTNGILIRKTTTEDLPRLLEIFSVAREFMRNTGNPNQWADDYPSKELLDQDIERGDSYVCINDGVVEATFVMREGNDPTYDIIYDGAWIADCPYVTIHRIASSGKLHGVFSAVINFALLHHNSIRIDTHKDNKVMQHSILNAGFHYCGIIHCWSGAERLAYQYVDSKI